MLIYNLKSLSYRIKILVIFIKWSKAEKPYRYHQPGRIFHSISRRQWLNQFITFYFYPHKQGHTRKQNPYPYLYNQYLLGISSHCKLDSDLSMTHAITLTPAEKNLQNPTSLYIIIFNWFLLKISFFFGYSNKKVIFTI